MDELVHNDTSGIAPNPIHPAPSPVNPQPNNTTIAPAKNDPFFVAPAKPDTASTTNDQTTVFKPEPAKETNDLRGWPKDNAKPKAPVEDPPDTKEQHFEAIRYLIDQLKTTTDAPTKATLENICTRLDEIEDKKTEKTVKW